MRKTIIHKIPEPNRFGCVVWALVRLDANGVTFFLVDKDEAMSIIDDLKNTL